MRTAPSSRPAQSPRPQSPATCGTSQSCPGTSCTYSRRWLSAYVLDRARPTPFSQPGRARRRLVVSRLTQCTPWPDTPCPCTPRTSPGWRRSRGPRPLHSRRGWTAGQREAYCGCSGIARLPLRRRRRVVGHRARRPGGNSITKLDRPTHAAEVAVLGVARARRHGSGVGVEAVVGG
jgi:hypothetical protein